MSTEFVKMQGLGNDFIVVDGRLSSVPLVAEKIRQLCDRRRGIGADALIVLEPVDKKSQAAVFMRIYNFDGSEAEACGNATRCVAGLLMRESGGDRIKIETRAGLLDTQSLSGGMVCVDMGKAYLDWQEISLSSEIKTENIDLKIPDLPPACAVGMGNPHAVFFVDDATQVPVEVLGPQVEVHPLFPARTNVEFVSLCGPSHLRMRVWERGVGVTPACGSGACASVVAAVQRGLVARGELVRVSLDGGDLHIMWRGQDGHVLMTGPWAEVFRGSFSF